MVKKEHPSRDFTMIVKCICLMMLCICRTLKVNECTLLLRVIQNVSSTVNPAVYLDTISGLCAFRRVKNLTGRIMTQSTTVCLWHNYMSWFYMKLWNYSWSTYVGVTGLLKKKELIVPAKHSFFINFHPLPWVLRTQNVDQGTFSGIEINQRPSISSFFPAIYN